MEMMHNALRRSAHSFIENGDLDQARVQVAALVGFVSTDQAERVFVTQSLKEIAEAEGPKLAQILRVAYDKSLRVDRKQREQENDSRRSRFGIPRF